MAQKTHNYPLQSTEVINEIGKVIDDASEELRRLNLEVIIPPSDLLRTTLTVTKRLDIQ